MLLSLSGLPFNVDDALVNKGHFFISLTTSFKWVCFASMQNIHGQMR